MGWFYDGVVWIYELYVVYCLGVVVWFVWYVDWMSCIVGWYVGFYDWCVGVWYVFVLLCEVGGGLVVICGWYGWIVGCDVWVLCDCCWWMVVGIV